MYNNDLGLVRSLLGTGDQAFLTSNKRREKDGSRPLHIAAACGYSQMVSLLLAAGM